MSPLLIVMNEDSFTEETKTAIAARPKTKVLKTTRTNSLCVSWVCGHVASSSE